MREPQYTKTNDHILRGHIAKIFGVSGRDLQDTLQVASSSGHVKLPFDLEEVVIVKEKFPILGAMVKPKRVTIFRDLMLELEHGTPVILTDSLLSSRDSLYAAMPIAIEDKHSMVYTWLDCMDLNFQLFMSTIDDTLIIAAPLQCFKRE